MIDPNFDPLASLEAAEFEILKLKHDVRILIQHDLETQKILKETAVQLSNLSQLIKLSRQEIRDLNHNLKVLLSKS